MAQLLPGLDSQTTQDLNLIAELGIKPRVFGMRLDHLLESENSLIHPDSSIDRAPDLHGTFERGADRTLLDAVNREIQNPLGDPVRQAAVELIHMALIHPDGETGPALNANAALERGALRMASDAINREMRNPSSDPISAIGNDLTQRAMQMQATAIMADLGIKPKGPSLAP